MPDPAPEPVEDNILKAAIIGLILRAKSLGLSRETLLTQVGGAWEMADKHQPTVAKLQGFWDLIKAEAGGKR